MTMDFFADQGLVVGRFEECCSHESIPSAAPNSRSRASGLSDIFPLVSCQCKDIP